MTTDESAKREGAIERLRKDLADADAGNQYAWLVRSDDLREALSALEASNKALREWIPVEERMPPSGMNVLAFYRNSYDKGRTIRAFWAAPHSMEASEEDNCGAVEETDDGDFLRSGWYESNENDEISYGVSERVTHWMPLPASPALAPALVDGKEKS